MYPYVTDIFLAIVTSAGEIGNICPSTKMQEDVCRIHKVYFFSLTSSLYDDFSSSLEVLRVQISRQTKRCGNHILPPTHLLCMSTVTCAPLTKILSSGTFYYAPNSHRNISTCLLERIKHVKSIGHDIGAFHGVSSGMNT